MIYFDSAATTYPSAAAMAGMAEAAKYPANPSSTHAAGREAAHFLDTCREKVCASLGIRRLGADRLIFTASGTEANCLSLLGSAYAKKRKPIHDCLGTILLSAGEHPSMEMPAKRLAENGYNVLHIPTTDGTLDLSFLAQTLTSIRENGDAPVVYAGCMLVNNETGALYDVKTAFRMIKSAFPDALCHVDAVQGYMKTRFTPTALGCDTLTVSAHKIHGTRGAGALYLSADTIQKKKVVPTQPGGGQEFGFRSGTENLFALGAFAWAAEDEMAHFNDNRQKEETLRATLMEDLAPVLAEGAVAHIPENHVPGILNLSMPGIRSEVMLNALSGRGICVSAGSACSAHAKKESAALAAFGVPKAEMDTAIRISLSHTNTIEEIHILTKAIREEMGHLARVRG